MSISVDQLPLSGKTALITGAAKRLGAASARALHAAGAHVVIHYRGSANAAEALRDELLLERADSASLVQADLLDSTSLKRLVQAAIDATGRLDILLNNASTYYPTPLAQASQTQWDELFGSNAHAPLFLAQAAATELKRNNGCIINMVDIHAIRPNPGHVLYCMAKASNAMMVKALALELAPDVRVNGVAPGAILWPEEAAAQAESANLPRIPLQRKGSENDIAQAVLYLATAPYVTGQIIAVDGGRTAQQ